jgi:hypothetical protein
MKPGEVHIGAHIEVWVIKRIEELEMLTPEPRLFINFTHAMTPDNRV